MDITIDQETVLKRDISWESYMSAKVISSTDLQLLRRYDKKSKEVKSSLISDDGVPYLKTFMFCLKNVSKDETIEYLLALLDELLALHPDKAKLFFSPKVVSDVNNDIYAVFLNLLTPMSWFIHEKACRIFTILLCAHDNKQDANDEKMLEAFRGLMEFICFQLREPEHDSRAIPLVVNSLSALLCDPIARTLMCELDGIKLLAPLITPVTSQQQMQILYESILCIWFLTFSPKAMTAISSTRIIPRLIEVAKSSPKEKVVRVAILSLKNLLNGGCFNSTMVELSLHKVVLSLKNQAWSDEDLKEALNSVEETLNRNIKHLSSFDKYKAEIISGSLEWTPVHKDISFWRDNIMHFEDNDFQLLRVLVTLLETSKEPKTLAITCHDLGLFIATHPSGRQVALDLKAKERVMPLMAHNDPDVQKQALLCIQKLLLSSKYASFIK